MEGYLALGESTLTVSRAQVSRSVTSGVSKFCPQPTEVKQAVKAARKEAQNGHGLAPSPTQLPSLALRAFQVGKGPSSGLQPFLRA